MIRAHRPGKRIIEEDILTVTDYYYQSTAVCLQRQCTVYLVAVNWYVVPVD